MFYRYIHMIYYIYICFFSLFFPRAHDTFLGFLAGQGRSPAGARPLIA